MLAKARTRDSPRPCANYHGGGRATDGSSATRRPSVPVEELFGDIQSDQIYDLLRTVYAKYRRSLQSDRRRLVGAFRTRSGGPKGRGGGQRRAAGVGGAAGGRRE